MTITDVAWLNSNTYIGNKLYLVSQNLVEICGSAIMAKVRPYLGTTTGWFIGQAAHLG